MATATAEMEAPTILRRRSAGARKALWTLNIDDYEPEITALTYPLMETYARKIGADFNEIRERKFPGWPPAYEKLQLYELGREYEWNIFADADTLINPDFYDPTNHLRKDTVAHNGQDIPADVRWRYDQYFLRDGRHIGSCNWFAVASEWCLDLWHPLEMPFEDAVKNIFPIQAEVSKYVQPLHLIDDYTLSRNIARYGLKHTTVNNLSREMGLLRPDGGPMQLMYHCYNVSPEEKLVQLHQTLEVWNL